MKKSNALLRCLLFTSAAITAGSVSAQNLRTHVEHAQIAGYSGETKLPNFIRFDPGMEIQPSQVEKLGRRFP